MISDTDKTYLKAFFANEPMAEAVKRALLEDDVNVVDIPLSDDDAEYGRKVKVQIGARMLVALRFNDLKRSVASNPHPTVENDSR